MNTSSYLNASDPNSMRDFGPTRNVIYNFSPQQAYQGTDKDSSDRETNKEKSEKSCNIVEFQRVKANDYTKNVSQTIFCPG